jgi:Holliday junction DNA helicase RuvA
MIGTLRGRLVSKHPPHLLVDVQGVGYELEAPMTTFYTLPDVGVEIHLYTHLVVREDAHLLFGFSSERERRMFRTLLKINGVGARLALTILSGIEADAFAACVLEGDAAQLVRLPGVGRKTAERLIVEMRDRLGDWEQTTAPSTSRAAAEPADASSDAVSALVALGYKPQEASRYVHAVAGEGMNSEEIIREALKASVR